MRVLIVDRSPVFRQALGDVLAAQPDMEVAAAEGRVDAAIQLMQRLRPDVVISEVDRPDDDAVRLIHACREISPSTRCVGLSTFTLPADRDDLAHSGVSVWLIKGARNTDIMTALRHATR